MNLKKAMDRWENRVSNYSLQNRVFVESAHSGNVTFMDLKLILEAFAEPPEEEPEEESKSAVLQKLCPACGFPNWYDVDDEEPPKCWKCTRPFITPAFRFGDLVKDKDSVLLGIIQKIEKDTAILLSTLSNNVLWWHTKNINDIEYIESNWHLKSFEEVFAKLTGDC